MHARDVERAHLNHTLVQVLFVVFLLDQVVHQYFLYV